MFEGDALQVIREVNSGPLFLAELGILFKDSGIYKYFCKFC
jgi:hypothetical protein